MDNYSLRYIDLSIDVAKNVAWYGITIIGSIEQPNPRIEHHLRLESFGKLF